MENKRKNRLYALKKEAQENSRRGAAKAGIDAFANSAESTEGDDINKFLKDIVTRKKERKKQLEIIHDFFENPAAYGVDTDLIPSSTTPEEIEQRKKELQHKIDLLRSVLKALEVEMQMLTQMKQADDNENVSQDEVSATENRKAKKKIAGKKTGRNKATTKKT
jgi:hypothetical protein